MQQGSTPLFLVHYNNRKANFSQVIVQRCIVYLIRNPVKYVPSKDYKAFTTSLKSCIQHKLLKVSILINER
ncbi:transposase [Macrococcoides canis]|nr:hypothetical protein GOY09_06270 [Macrococcus canis]UTH00139.1 transposase [Macrococcus canis]UTH06893.1 transposase [Macrococcus canis]